MTVLLVVLLFLAPVLITVLAVWLLSHTKYFPVARHYRYRSLDELCRPSMTERARRRIKILCGQAEV